MGLQFDTIHIIGYVGAIGSLLFGANQLRLILVHDSASVVSVFDYGLRVGYSVLLGIYAAGKSDLVFIVMNFGAAVLSLVVAVASRITQEHGGDGGRRHERGGARSGRSA